MIAEENLSDGIIKDIAISKQSLILLIRDLMKETIPKFYDYINSGFHKKKVLSEDDFTQIYTTQAQILIRRNDLPFNVGSQYKDSYNLSKGLSDFYFFTNEEGYSTESLYSVESKRLPTLPKSTREKEYVIGDDKNGGIERYKIEKHGKGLFQCGLLAFVEKETNNYWLTSINNWIEDLAKGDDTWNKSEVLTETEIGVNFGCYESICNRVSSKIQLHHLWILIPNKEIGMTKKKRA